MKSHRVLSVVAVILLNAALAGFAAAQAAPVYVSTVGSLTREQVRAILDAGQIDFVSDPSWSEKIEALRQVRQGATVKVFLGTWCEDSRHEVPQFMRILDVLDDEAPFTVEFIGVDKEKQLPRPEVEANQIWYLPTFIILRDGLEVGRIVEHPARTLEKDLLRLLNGTAHGLISSNEDAIGRYLLGWQPQP
jgi:thiol-disulfide isomerase/thioredoxin